MRPLEDIPYDTAARDRRAAQRTAQRTYNRSARQVACEAVGLTLGKARNASLADDFGDGSGDYVTKPPRLRLLEGRQVFDEGANREYLKWLAREPKGKTLTDDDRPTRHRDDVAQLGHDVAQRPPVEAELGHGEVQHVEVLADDAEREHAPSYAEEWEEHQAKRRATLARRFARVQDREHE